MNIKALVFLAAACFGCQLHAALAGAVRVNTDTTGTNTLGTNTIIVASTNAAMKGNVTLHGLTATGAVSAASVAVTGAITGGGTNVWGSLAGKATGPSSVTDNSVALFDGTTGKLLKELAPGSDGSVLRWASGILGNSFDGSALISLNADELDSGTVPQARLPVSPTFTSLTITGSASGYVLLGDVTNDNSIRITAPSDVLTNVNIVFPDRPGSSGVLHGTVSAVTNLTLSVSSVVESDITFSDNTTGNASTSAHGFLPKLNNDSATFLNGQGSWATPSGSGGGLGYVICLTADVGINPLDSTSYYVGADMARGASTTYSEKRVIVLKAGTIKGLYVKIWIQTSNGSSENVTHSVRLNDTTDVGSVQFAYDTQVNDGYATNLTQAVVAGDYVAVKVATPAWATNPSSVRYFAMIYIE